MRVIAIAGEMDYTVNYVNALLYAGKKSRVTLCPEDVFWCDGLILPGGGVLPPPSGERKIRHLGIGTLRWILHRLLCCSGR